jgi:hypothetical protein
VRQPYHHGRIRCRPPWPRSSRSPDWWARSSSPSSTGWPGAAGSTPTALVGALLLSLADTAGRSVIAPAQVPAGLVVALIGAPYLIWLRYRSRA